MKAVIIIYTAMLTSTFGLQWENDDSIDDSTVTVENGVGDKKTGFQWASEDDGFGDKKTGFQWASEDDGFGDKKSGFQWASEDEDDIPLPMIRDFELVENCQTWQCISNNYRLQVQEDPNNSFDLADLAYEQFGSESLIYIKLSAMYATLRLDSPVVFNARFEDGEGEFKTTGYLKDYMNDGELDTRIETIFSAQKGGHMYMVSGITFPKTEIMKEEFAIANQERSDAELNIKELDHRDLSLNTKMGAGLIAAIGLFGGGSIDPSALGFLNDHGELGIIAVQSARLEPVIWESIKDTVADKQKSKFKLSGILEPEIWQDGVVLIASVSLKPDCEGNFICKLLTIATPKGSRLLAKYNMGFHHDEANNMFGQKRIDIAIANLILFDGLILREAGMFMIIAPGGYMYGFQGSVSLSLSGSDLIFKAESMTSISFLKPAALTLSMAMIGIWKKFCGIPFVSLGNVQVTTKVEVTGATRFFAAGGEIMLGRIPGPEKADTRIKGKFFGALEMDFPFTKTYIYCTISVISMQSIINMVVGHTNAKLPDVIGSNGLHPLEGKDGVLFSYSLIDQQVPNTMPPITVRAGIRLQGQIKILGWSAVCDTVIDFEELYVDMFFQLSPVEFAGGILKMYKSENDKDNGPLLTMKGQFKKKEVPTIKGDCYVSLLGVSRSVHLLISKQGSFFRSELKIWNLYSSLTEVTVNENRARIMGQFLFGSMIKTIISGVTNLFTGIGRVFKKRRRRLNWFKRAWKKSVNKIKHVAKKTVSKIKNITKKSVKKVAKVGKAVKNFFDSSFKITRIYYDLDLKFANKKSFEVGIDMELKVAGKMNKISDKFTLDLTAVGKVSKDIFSKVKHFFKK